MVAKVVTPPPTNVELAEEFLQSLELYREALDDEGRDLSADETKSIREEWADLVKRAEDQPEQATSDPIMLTDVDPYLTPRNDHSHDHQQFSLYAE